MKRYPAQIKALEEQIRALESDLATLAAHNPPPEQWTMAVDGSAYRKEKLAGAALLAFGKTLSAGEEVQAGSYRGLTLRLKKTKSIFDETEYFLVLRLQGQASYPVDLGRDPRGNVTRIDNALEQLPEELEQAKERLTVLREQTASAQAESQKPWPMEEIWREKSARLLQLNADLSSGVDDESQPAEEDGMEL